MMKDDKSFNASVSLAMANGVVRPTPLRGLQAARAPRGAAERRGPESPEGAARDHRGRRRCAFEQP